MISTFVFGIVYALLFLIIAFFLFWRLWFCRQPRRQMPKGDKVIVSPANGTVAVVRRFDTTLAKKTIKAQKWNTGSVEFLAQDVAQRGWFVLIVMTPLNVHYQRAPFAGKVIGTHYAPGKFHNAVKNAEKLLTLENEKNEILFEGKDGRFKVVQIAGVLARRISCFVGKNHKVEKGQVIGFINIGSQVALLLPAKARLSVKEGDAVVDGETVIGAFK